VSSRFSDIRDLLISYYKSEIIYFGKKNSPVKERVLQMLHDVLRKMKRTREKWYIWKGVATYDTVLPEIW